LLGWQIFFSLKKLPDRLLMTVSLASPFSLVVGSSVGVFVGMDACVVILVVVFVEKLPTGFVVARASSHAVTVSIRFVEILL